MGDEPRTETTQMDYMLSKADKTALMTVLARFCSDLAIGIHKHTGLDFIAVTTGQIRSLSPRIATSAGT